MTRAIARMQDWLAEHDAQRLAEISAPFFPGVAYDVLLVSLERYRKAGIWSSTPKVSRAGFARLGESLVSGGFLTHMPIYEDCVDQSVGF
jgi:NitT/TauT family transport system substrate-binding protein